MWNAVRDCRENEFSLTGLVVIGSIAGSFISKF